MTIKTARSRIAVIQEGGTCDEYPSVNKYKAVIVDTLQIRSVLVHHCCVYLLAELNDSD